MIERRHRATGGVIDHGNQHLKNLLTTADQPPFFFKIATA
jgi:hypothetical protein